MRFKDFINENFTLGTENVDSSQIEAAYNKAKLSVKLVQLYDSSTNQHLLKNINTIATLGSGVFGMYMSHENRRAIGKNVVDQFKLLFPQDMMLSQKLQTLPSAVIKQYFPNVNERDLQPSDTIRVNVHSIVSKFGDTKEAIVEIASTIIHEATHDMDFHNKTQSLSKAQAETNADNAETAFENWVQKNWEFIKQRIPEFARM